ncbi:hypothetical protein [Comamonas sp. B-9]|uniref:hypothetical protein n=1 Tax=Comamonas sp. B-9 TaxID=1055192 RepID=UPI00039567B5|nr:hypothetical protein [Comamonas sp. B-9]
MAYKNPDHARTAKKTVRFRPEDWAMLEVMAMRLKTEPATLVYEMTMRRVDPELEALGLGDVAHQMRAGAAC